MDTSHKEIMKLLTTDARPNNEIQTAGNPRRTIINAEILKQIEPELEEFEQIAIIFLLAAEIPDSYSTVLEICRNIKNCPHIITEYIKNNVDIWCDKLVEAMTVIGNYEILQNLGFSKTSELDDKYIPSIPRYTVLLNEATKVLYKLFEALNIEKTQQLLQRVYEEGKIAKQFDSLYLELHALYWLQEGYITISSGGSVNLTNLHKHLKMLGLYTESIFHDVEYFCSKTSNTVDSNSQEEPVSTTHKLLELSPNIQLPVNGRKPTKIIKKGLCVIINEVDFVFPYKRRDGSEADVDNLCKSFKRRNFDMLTRKNLTKEGTIELLKDMPDKFKENNYDCLVICILSHGYKGGIITCDGKEIPIKVIEDKICAQTLQDTIKILIVQACQGTSIGNVSGKSDLTTDGPRESIAISDDRESDLMTDAPTTNILRHSHFAQFMSTMDDFVSMRHKKLGSWFIEAVCEELSRTTMVSLSDWSKDVIANVSSKSGQLGDVRMASQIPSWTTRLGMTVFFPPYIDNENIELPAST